MKIALTIIVIKYIADSKIKIMKEDLFLQLIHAIKSWNIAILMNRTNPSKHLLL